MALTTTIVIVGRGHLAAEHSVANLSTNVRPMSLVAWSIRPRKIAVVSRQR